MPQRGEKTEPKAIVVNGEVETDKNGRPLQKRKVKLRDHMTRAQIDALIKSKANAAK